MRNLTRIAVLYGIATPIFVGAILLRDTATGSVLEGFLVVKKAGDIAAVGIVAVLATGAALLALLFGTIYVRAIVAVFARAPGQVGCADVQR